MTDLAAARTFVHTHARLLDRRRFQHLVDGAPADLVLSALRAYRNTDGGVGALEPDLRSPDSQPIPPATSSTSSPSSRPRTRSGPWPSARWTG